MSLASNRLPDHQPASSVKSMSDDSCAINELLEGRMELAVTVPAYLIKNQKTNSPTILVLINVERSTPMLDLLIQIGNKIKFNVNDYRIAVDELRTGYKASTPIGSLDVSQIAIVPKTAAAIALDREKLRLLNLANQQNQQKSISTFNKLVQNSNLNSQPSLSNGSLNGSGGTIPFQTTFRLQVNLPYNQRMVFRVTPTTKICEVKELVCEEKELNEDKYHLVVFADLKQKQHPQILEPERSLAFYAVNEISLISTKHLEQMQVQNEISGLNGRLNGKPDDNLDSNSSSSGSHLTSKLNGCGNLANNSSLSSIVNSQSTAASVPRKAIIALLSATNQLEANCDYSNNICTKNRCVCNLSSIANGSRDACQKRFAKNGSSNCLNRLGRHKKARAPLPPTQSSQITSKLNSKNLKRSISNHSMSANEKLIKDEQQKAKSTSSKQRHNSGSDSSGYHECLSTANSPNSQHQFGGSMINLSNNSLTVSPILEQRLTSTPSSKQQYLSVQQLNYLKKRKAPQPPTSLPKSPLIERRLSEQSEQSTDKPNDKKTSIAAEVASAKVEPKAEMSKEHEKHSGTSSPSIKSSTQSLHSDSGQRNDNLHLELQKEPTAYPNGYSSAKSSNLKSNSSFKSDASSGHSSGHSSSNSPELNELNDKDELISSSLNDASLEEVRNENSSGAAVNRKNLAGAEQGLKLSKLVKESLESRSMNSKSPTSVASEPIYLTPKTYFNNQSQASESTSSIVMLNLDEVRPSSAPNYCEDSEQTSSYSSKVASASEPRAHNLTNQIRTQNEHSKDSGIFLKDSVTVNNQPIKSSSPVPETVRREEKQQNGKSESKENNVTTLIINVNGEAAKEEDKKEDMKEDIKSVSTYVENGDLLIEGQQEDVINNSIGNVAPASCAIKLGEEKAVKPEVASTEPVQRESASQAKSRILNIREQFEQSTALSTNKPKIKLTNFKIGSYSTNQEEDIYSDAPKAAYSLDNARLQANLITKQPVFRYLSSPVNLAIQEESRETVRDTTDAKSKAVERSNSQMNQPTVPIKKSNLNEKIKFKEIALNEGLNGSELNKLHNGAHHKEVDNYNSDEFNDNPELTSLYLNDNEHHLIDHYSAFNYQAERLCNNLSMITPQPYKNNRTAVPRKLFFGKKISEKLNNGTKLMRDGKVPSASIKQPFVSDSRVLTPPPMPGSGDLSDGLKKYSVSSSNSFKEDKLENTRSYLISEVRKNPNPLNGSMNRSKANLSDCHSSLMDEIRSFGRNSLKGVRN